MITLKAIKALKNCEDLTHTFRAGYLWTVWYRPEIFSTIDVHPMVYKVSVYGLGEFKKQHYNAAEEVWAAYKNFVKEM